MYSPEDWAEILELRKKIEEAAFKKKVFSHRGDLSRDIDPFEIRLPSKHIPLYELREAFDEKEIDLKDLTDYTRNVSDLALELAEIIWQHKEYMKPGVARRELKVAKRVVLQPVRQHLLDQGYSQKNVDAALRPLGKSKVVTKRLKEYERSDQHEYFAAIKPKGDAWVARERELFSRMREAYRKHLKDTLLHHLSDRQIIHSIATVSEAVDLWPKDYGKGKSQQIETYYEKIRSGLREFDQHAPAELFDPPKTPEN